VKTKYPYIIVSLILIAVFSLGFLAGFSGHRPIKEALTKQEMVDQVGPEDFLDSMREKLTGDLSLTDEQKPKIDEILLRMQELIHEAQRDFHPKVERIQINAIDEMVDFLDEDQKSKMERKREFLSSSPRLQQMRRGFGPPPGGGPPRRGGGPPPWGNGPPPRGWQGQGGPGQRPQGPPPQESQNQDP
jgi:hypothetical protein